MRALLTADWHVGARPDLLGPTYGPGSRLADHETVLARICDIAETERVDAVVFAGDLTDKPRPAPWELLVAQHALGALAQVAPVFAINGNAHDVVSGDLPIALELMGGITLCRDPRVVPFSGAHASGQYENRNKTSPEIRVACLPWASTARIRAMHGGGDGDLTNEHAVDLLMTVAAGMRAQHDGPMILVSHFACSGDQDGISQFAREPVLDPYALQSLGYQAVVLGHYHRAQLLGSPDGPPVLFTGSPMALSFGEAGYDHGVWILDVDDGGAVARFVPIEAPHPFVTHDLDLVTDDGIFDLAYLPDVVPGSIIRVRYTATEEQARRIDHRQIEQALLEAGAVRVFIEPTVERASRARVQEITGDLGDTEALDLWLVQAGYDEAARAGLLARAQEFIEAVSA